MEAGREQRMIEMDRSPSQFCSKERGLSLAAGCHRARLYQVRGGHEGMKKDWAGVARLRALMLRNLSRDLVLCLDVLLWIAG